MKPLLIILFFLLTGTSQLSAQARSARHNTIAEFEGQHFMPYAEGVTSSSMMADQGISKTLQSQVNLLKKKLDSCTEVFREDIENYIYYRNRTVDYGYFRVHQLNLATYEETDTGEIVGKPE